MVLNKNEIINFRKSKKTKIKLYTTSISAGFPSPAEDHMDISLDINEYLVKHPSSTFYIYVKGDSMIDSGIFDGDLLIVDRSLEVKSNSVVVAVIDGDFTVKKIKKDSGNLYFGGGGGSPKSYVSSDGNSINGNGGLGGGADAGNQQGSAGTANTGGGGSGGRDRSDGHGWEGGNGGSGVVILRYPNTFTITVGAGLTSSTITQGDNKVTIFTAGSGNVSFA